MVSLQKADNSHGVIEHIYYVIGVFLFFNGRGNIGGTSADGFDRYDHFHIGIRGNYHVQLYRAYTDV